MNEIQFITIIGSNLLVFLTFFVASITMFLSNRKQSREDWTRCQNTLDAIQDEMKEFHIKMYKLEKDFNAKILKIEMDRRK